jgi:heme-degrading monooxygenase HmoA
LKIQNEEKINTTKEGKEVLILTTFRNAGHMNKYRKEESKIQSRNTNYESRDCYVNDTEHDGHETQNVVYRIVTNVSETH